MKRAYVRTSGILAAGLVSVLFLGNSAFAQLVSRERILDALMMQPAPPSLPSRPILTRSMTLNDHDDYVLASTRPTAAVDLEVYFDFNSAAVTVDALPQLHELGAALADPRLKGAMISINGHTDAAGNNALNQKLSQRRAAAIKQYLMDAFRLPAAKLRAVGYGKQRPKNTADLFAPENRRVEIVNEAPRVQAQR
jgi:outer membrane protein OmpA-like peptidoglycan-associated protein